LDQYTFYTEPDAGFFQYGSGSRKTTLDQRTNNKFGRKFFVNKKVDILLNRALVYGIIFENLKLKIKLKIYLEVRLRFRPELESS